MLEFHKCITLIMNMVDYYERTKTRKSKVQTIKNNLIWIYVSRMVSLIVFLLSRTQKLLEKIALVGCSKFFILVLMEIGRNS